MTVLLEADGVRLAGPGRPLLDLARLEVRARELLVVLGPTGAGKSTLLRVLNLLQRPDAGTLRWRGEPVPWPAPLPLRRRIAMAFQDPLLLSGTVADNVGYGLRLRGLSRVEVRARTGELLDMMGLAGLADRRADRISGGEAQRTALARALAVRPELLLLDEPLANLDAPIRERIARDLQAALRELRIACVFVTHHQREAIALGDRLAVLHQGRLLQEGTAADVFRRPASAFVAGFVRTLNLLPGRVDGGRTFRGAGGWALELPADAPAGPGLLCIRPEELVLHADGPATPDHWPVTVADVRDQGATLQVALRGPVDLVALLTHREARALGLEAGVRCRVELPAAGLHFIPDPAHAEGSIEEPRGPQP